MLVLVLTEEFVAAALTAQGYIKPPFLSTCFVRIEATSGAWHSVSFLIVALQRLLAKVSRGDIPKCRTKKRSAALGTGATYKRELG